MCELCARNMERLGEQYSELIELQRMILQHQISELPKFLTQARLYLLSATQLNFNLHSQSQVAYRVTGWIVQTSSPGTLVMQDRSIPINGLDIRDLGVDGLILRPEDQVLLTQTVAGAISIEFFGQELADRGKRW
jgi:hypothetical protein